MRTFLTSCLLCTSLACAGATPVAHPQASDTPAAPTQQTPAPAAQTETSGELVFEGHAGPDDAGDADQHDYKVDLVNGECAFRDTVDNRVVEFKGTCHQTGADGPWKTVALDGEQHITDDGVDETKPYQHTIRIARFGDLPADLQAQYAEHLDPPLNAEAAERQKRTCFAIRDRVYC